MEQSIKSPAERKASMGLGWSPEVQGRQGGEVELDCSLPPPGPSRAGSASPHVVEWVRRGFDIPILINVLGKLKADQLCWSQHTAGPHARSLVPCHFPRRRGPETSESDVQSGTAPPTFTKTPPSVMEALVGSRLSLSCVANGNPSPSITWLKDGAGLQDEDVEVQGGALLLRAVTPQLGGQYGCRPPVIVIPPKSTSLNMSQNALLRCQATADPPNMTYVWWKGRENVHHVESMKSRVKIMVDGTLLISRLTPEDSGKYTCMPTNGLLVPPTASADLTVMHPALALPMPGETYLPTGMRGLITCPSSANPPLLHVDWTKDGSALDLTLYPGWTLTSKGSLSMATVNEDSMGVYVCTPTNGFGSMGSSGPTQGVTARNGSLLLQPLTKDQQGAWECRVTNRVASVNATTRVLVLAWMGKMWSQQLHAKVSKENATAVRMVKQISPLNSNNHQHHDEADDNSDDDQMKKKKKKKEELPQDWFSVSVPPSSGPHHLVRGLSPTTKYQFSVLAQNAAAPGPSASWCPSAPWVDAPIPRRAWLSPPGDLSINLTLAGVILRWAPPPAQHPPITALVLQARPEHGEWLVLDRDIDANASEVVVPGLRKRTVASVECSQN
ncbi:hypothetical protein CRUP_015409 [Coryphaenoides rupestris]|nr:hypothetical protein CRUP_015409 [Coryphaenoides rupestris]